jgi:hypothetical protein
MSENIQTTSQGAPDNWSVENDRYLHHLVSRLQKYMTTHVNISRQASTAYSRITLSMLIISPLVGFLPLIELIPVYGHSLTTALPVCIGVPMGILTAYLKFSKFEDTITINNKAVIDYRSLISEIQFQLDREVVDRKKRIDFFTWVELEYNRLLKLLPPDVPIIMDDACESCDGNEKNETMVTLKGTAMSDYELARYASRFCT